MWNEVVDRTRSEQLSRNLKRRMALKRIMDEQKSKAIEKEKDERRRFEAFGHVEETLRITESNWSMQKTTSQEEAAGTGLKA